MQALLIYELGNRNHLKNINYQNFAHFMRGYDKGFYGIDKFIEILEISIIILISITNHHLKINFYQIKKIKVYIMK